MSLEIISAIDFCSLILRHQKAKINQKTKIFADSNHIICEESLEKVAFDSLEA